MTFDVALKNGKGGIDVNFCANEVPDGYTLFRDEIIRMFGFGEWWSELISIACEMVVNILICRE